MCEPDKETTGSESQYDGMLVKSLQKTRFLNQIPTRIHSDRPLASAIGELVLQRSRGLLAKDTSCPGFEIRCLRSCASPFVPQALRDKCLSAVHSDDKPAPAPPFQSEFQRLHACSHHFAFPYQVSAYRKRNAFARGHCSLDGVRCDKGSLAA